MANNGGNDGLRTWLGFLLALAGLVLVGIVFWITSNKFSTATDIAAVVGAVTGVVGTIVAAFFGINAAASSSDKAQANARDAQAKFAKLAGLGMSAAALADPTKPEIRQLLDELKEFQ